MTNSVAKKRLALFASGRGSNGEALYKAMQEGLINGEFVVIITDHADAGIVERSKGWGIPLIAIERSQFDSKQAFEQPNWMLLSRIVLMVLCWPATCVL